MTDFDRALLFLPFIAIAAPSPAKAQPVNCAPRHVIVARLEEGYGETRQSIGLGGNNSLMELFASAETGTWTIALTLPNGLTCLMASGQAFETTPNSPPDAKASHL